MKAFVFSGQGSQKEKMGHSLIEASRQAAWVYEEAADALGLDILNLNQEQLTQTLYAQLAIVTMSLAAWQAIKPQLSSLTDQLAFAGFSLGEYSALAAAGVLDLPQVLELVQVRSQLMQEAAEKTPGAMFAILGADDDKVEQILQEQFTGKVFPVNYNAPGQLVISGLAQETAAAAEVLLAAGAKRAIKLNVNGAFHTPLMLAAADKLFAFAQELTFSAYKGRIYSNAKAAALTAPLDWPKVLQQHMISPVQWHRQVKQMQADGYSNFTECGYGRVLCGLIRKIDRSIQVDAVDSADSLTNFSSI